MLPPHSSSKPAAADSGAEPFIRLRKLAADDLDEALELNNQAVPNVNALTRARFEEILGECTYRTVAAAAGSIVGFLLALGPGQRYDSPNYRWFEQHFRHWAYVDRVVVAPAYRGRGVGKRLYADLEASVSPGTRFIACEVNLRPPNPGSIAFHTRGGFEAVGSQDVDGGTKTVQMMLKRLARPA